MKRIVAIVFLWLLLFNMAGFYLSYLAARFAMPTPQKASGEFSSYVQGSVILKIPFTLPYWNDSKQYEPATGRIAIEGRQYQIMERKLVKDTLYVVCLPDRAEQKAKSLLSFCNKLMDSPISPEAFKLLLSLARSYLPGRPSGMAPDAGRLIRPVFPGDMKDIVPFAPQVPSPPPKLG